MVLLDPVRGGSEELRFGAHVRGLVSLEASGDLLATTGWGSRAGQTVPDPFIKARPGSSFVPRDGDVSGYGKAAQCGRML